VQRTLVSWNLNGLDDHLLDERTESACLALLLRDDPADVILLQELVLRSWHGHWKHHLHHAGYDVFPPDPPAATDSEYFSTIAVRRELSVAAHGVERFPNSQMGRALLWVRAGGWWFGTAHLESGAAASDERRTQLAIVARHLLAEPGPAVFAGDTNLRRDEAEGVPGTEELVDAWVAAGRDPKTRATWFPLRRQEDLLGGARRIPGARFDRALHNAALATVALRTAPAEVYGLQASDHLPLWVTLGTTEV
jgi:endonuclease/exonuclease/phosphatase family metal-dependent hydrolase